MGKRGKKRKAKSVMAVQQQNNLFLLEEILERTDPLRRAIAGQGQNLSDAVSKRHERDAGKENQC